MNPSPSFPYIDEETASRVLCKAENMIKAYREDCEKEYVRNATEQLSEAMSRRLNSVISTKLEAIRFDPGLQSAERQDRREESLANALRPHLETAQQLWKLLE